MSDDQAKMTKTTPQQFFVALWAGMFAPIIAIALILGLIAKIQGSHGEKDSLEFNSKATLARIQPVGELNIVDASAPRVEKEGKQVFNEVCTACHTPGALGAPKFGNKADWAPRIKQGYATLIKHAEEGIRQMPPRGGNPDLSDIEIARAVAYMADDAGAKFTPPESPAAGATPAAGAAPAGGAAPAAPAAPPAAKSK
jgi:cytochrome c5